MHPIAAANYHQRQAIVTTPATIPMSADDNRVELMSRDAVERVVFASAPEEEAALRDLWAKHSHHFSLVDDRAGMTLDAGAFGIVRFSNWLRTRGGARKTGDGRRS